MWNNCDNTVLLYHMIRALQFTLYFEFSTCLINDQPLANTCNALICAMVTLTWVLFIDLVLSNEGTTLVVVSLRLVYCLLSLDLLYNVWYYLVATLLTSTFKNFVPVISESSTQICHLFLSVVCTLATR